MKGFATLRASRIQPELVTKVPELLKVLSFCPWAFFPSLRQSLKGTGSRSPSTPRVTVSLPTGLPSSPTPRATCLGPQQDPARNHHAGCAQDKGFPPFHGTSGQTDSSISKPRLRGGGGGCSQPSGAQRSALRRNRGSRTGADHGGRELQ